MFWQNCIVENMKTFHWIAWGKLAIRQNSAGMGLPSRSAKLGLQCWQFAYWYTGPLG